jgi:hypothetical protein
VWTTCKTRPANTFEVQTLYFSDLSNFEPMSTDARCARFQQLKQVLPQRAGTIRRRLISVVVLAAACLGGNSSSLRRLRTRPRVVGPGCIVEPPHQAAAERVAFPNAKPAAESHCSFGTFAPVGPSTGRAAAPSPAGPPVPLRKPPEPNGSTSSEVHGPANSAYGGVITRMSLSEQQARLKAAQWLSAPQVDPMISPYPNPYGRTVASALEKLKEAQLIAAGAVA